MSEHDLTDPGDESDGEPEEIREGVSLPGKDVEVPEEIEERLRERPETATERELD